MGKHKRTDSSSSEGSSNKGKIKKILNNARSTVAPPGGRTDTPLEEVPNVAPKFKLTYFDIRGLGETIRFLFKYGKIEFEDECIPRENWILFKIKMPFGQLPVLTIEGKSYAQSLAIARFVAKKVKLIGADDFEDMEIDSIVDTINDLRIKLVTWGFEADATIKAAKKHALMNETVPFYLDRIEKIVKENAGHLACKKLTWADFYFVAISDMLSFFVGYDVFSKYPGLDLVRKNVHALPAIDKWIQTRPNSEF